MTNHERVAADGEEAKKQVAENARKSGAEAYDSAADALAKAKKTEDEKSRAAA